MTFSLQLPLTSIISLSVCAFACIYILTYYRRYLLRVIRKTPPHKNIPGDNYPEITIAVYARDNAEELRALLPILIEQDYPNNLEIIIVNDGECEDVKDVFNFFSHRHKNIYITFVPAGAKNLSRRKLAITLGVKAAHTNHILFIDADCKPSGKLWAKSMSEPFAKGKSITLGRTYYSTKQFSEECSAISRFYWLNSLIAWINSAIACKPYRGDIRNIGFTRDIFMQNKGFSRTLNLHGGADDIFISEIADSENCSVVTASDGAVEIAGNVNIKRDWKHQRMSHYFTSRHLRKGSRRIISSGSVILWIAAICSLLSILYAPHSIFSISAVVILAIILWLSISIIFKKIIVWSRVRLPFWISPILMLYYPFDGIIWKIRSRLNRSYEYTWY